ncbi:unnamed protein product [Rotaria sordida]|uniref:VIT domain-containing protein n=1 Tax=Rotaria sordida TaxID=392033 RepID=A0A815IFM0_9BILA|nr:unnamed protein product [Rotaria sordida]CAF1365265.1 unnamed protein product [Rotaria sordida]
MLQTVNQTNQLTQIVPLKNVNIPSTIRSFAADVTITQVFSNDETIPIEAVYCFPIEEQAAIYAFIARIDNREIVAELKEKKEAQKYYTEALEQGHGAYLKMKNHKITSLSTLVHCFRRKNVQSRSLYNEDNARQAEVLVKTMKADLGGTELLEPLKWLEQHAPTQGQYRQIFLLTDGEISNVTEVLDLCRSMASSTRIFSFDLGHSPSRSLVKGLARSTNGRFVFIPPNSTVDVYVGKQLQKALQQCINNVGVKWNFSTAVVETIPNQLQPVYAKDCLIVYGLLDDKSISFDHNSSIELEVDQQQLSVARISRIPSISENGMITRLAAKALILELQHAKLPAKRTTVGSRQSRFQDNTISTMWYDEDSEEDAHQNIGLMSGKTTEKNPNYEKSDKCQCTKGCSKRSCSCFKYGSECNSSCGCGSSCRNMFNHLEYFFGENQKCSVNPCFSKWLVKNAKNTDGFQMIDCDKLR